MRTDTPIVDAAILKVASRCNINCTYCYMYNLADKTYIDQPKFMSRQTIDSFFRWLEQYILQLEIMHFYFSLHGGEPLLAGIDRLQYISDLRDNVENVTGAQISIGSITNGLLLNDQWMEFFSSNKIRFGISLDGPQEYHDAFRLTHQSEGTHAAVQERLQWVLDHPLRDDVFSSILCVIHPEMDGKKLFRYFYELGVPGVDFILPDQNYTTKSEHYKAPRDVPTYGVVLADAYRAWRETDDSSFKIRKFEMGIKATLGITPGLDSMGPGPITVFTVETDGQIEPVDSLKACGHGFTKTGIGEHQLLDVDPNRIPLIQMGLHKTAELPEKCLQCRNFRICGGGYLPHRYNKNNGFANPTVYCADMMHICDVIQSDVLEQLRSLPAHGISAGA